MPFTKVSKGSQFTVASISGSCSSSSCSSPDVLVTSQGVAPRTTSSGDGLIPDSVRRFATRGAPCTRSSWRLACTRFGVSESPGMCSSSSMLDISAAKSVGSLIVPKNEPEVFIRLSPSSEAWSSSPFSSRSSELPAPVSTRMLKCTNLTKLSSRPSDGPSPASLSSQGRCDDPVCLV